MYVLELWPLTVGLRIGETDFPRSVTKSGGFRDGPKLEMGAGRGTDVSPVLLEGPCGWNSRDDRRSGILVNGR